ncbi:unnamed protein product [Lasius platythorax]|uniref:MADF domain-containing protein n=1 Tax=Lasius platythorax TaxID=488582 RepID=A0AAV2MW14_9HYME
MAGRIEIASESTNEETLSVSYTCGVCETILEDEDERNHHPCFEAYKYVYIDDNFYIYPQCNDGQIIRKSLVGDAEVVVMETTPETTPTQAQSPSEETSDWRNKKIREEEQLIEEVSKRPALWNFKLPLVERNLQIKKKLWEEIYASMNGTMDIPTMKKKWKSLSDSFRIHKNKQHQPSGSAAARKNTWMHFERMQFLNDVLLENDSTTNIPVDIPYENIEESNDAENTIYDGNSSSSGRGSRNSKRRLSIDDSVDGIIDRLSDALSQPVTVNVPPFMPPAPSVDKATLFGNLITAHLKELDPQLVDNVMLQILQIINAAKQKSNRN